MAVREIVLMGDPVLREEALEVTDFDRDLRSLVRDLYESMYHAEGVGLATTRSVVLSLLTVFVANAALTALFFF